MQLGVSIFRRLDFLYPNNAPQKLLLCLPHKQMSQSIVNCIFGELIDCSDVIIMLQLIGTLTTYFLLVVQLRSNQLGTTNCLSNAATNVTSAVG